MCDGVLEFHFDMAKSYAILEKVFAAIFGIPENGMFDGRKLRSNLMVPSCDEVDRDKRGAIFFLQDRVVKNRFFSVRINK